MVQSVDGLVLFFFFLEVHNEIITAYIVYFTLSVALLCNPYICAIQIPRRATRLSARGCAGLAFFSSTELRAQSLKANYLAMYILLALQYFPGSAQL